MKKILITGLNSYIGTSLKDWLLKDNENYEISNINLKDISWKDADLSKYDIVCHSAGIVHLNELEVNKELYFEINRDLALEVAKKSKKDGVGQFIFLSTMSVYGMEKGNITKDTTPCPKSNYGKSKLEAEEMIYELNSEDFKVSILRPPMVYGRGCTGNYTRLSKLARKTPIFPKVKNKRSMIYIDNLSEFLKQIIDLEKNGYFYPQNSEYVNTSEMVYLISKYNNSKIFMFPFFTSVINLMNMNIINKVFGSLTYDLSMSKYDFEYQLVSFEKSIEATEIKE